jgi:hypothetical protein
MIRIAFAASIAVSVAGLAPAASAQNLLSCDVQEVRGSGENTEVIYSMNCRPVIGGDVASVRSGQNGEIEVTYGSGMPALGGGPVYVLRFNNPHGEAMHYGPPLDGNVGTVGR